MGDFQYCNSFDSVVWIIEYGSKNYYNSVKSLTKRLTPSKAHVTSDAGVPIGEEGQEHQVMQVKTLHQYPEVIGEYEILAQACERLAQPAALLFVHQPVGFPVFNHHVRGEGDPRDEQDVLHEGHERSQHERGEQMHVEHVSRAS